MFRNYESQCSFFFFLAPARSIRFCAVAIARSRDFAALLYGVYSSFPPLGIECVVPRSRAHGKPATLRNKETAHEQRVMINQ